MFGYKIKNEPPTDLNASVPLEILENQPAGTLVSQFSASDLDANSSLSYSLIEEKWIGLGLFRSRSQWHLTNRGFFRL